jgi:hypothetical protein
MRIIKHKSRRRLDPAPWYYVIEGVHAVATAEEAADIAMETHAREVKQATPALTIWDLFADVRHS